MISNWLPNCGHPLWPETTMWRACVLVKPDTVIYQNDNIKTKEKEGMLTEKSIITNSHLINADFWSQETVACKYLDYRSTVFFSYQKSHKWHPFLWVTLIQSLVCIKVQTVLAHSSYHCSAIFQRMSLLSAVHWFLEMTSCSGSEAEQLLMDCSWWLRKLRGPYTHNRQNQYITFK